MPRVTNLYKKLKARGLTVEYVPGWSTRGSAHFSPKGVVAHWTAGPRDSDKRPSLNVCTYGHGTLPGPLCNVYLARDGVAVVVAAGRANHAGGGSWKGHSGNSSFLGIEAEAADGADWTDAQRDAYPLVCAGLLDAIGETDASYVCGHSEYAVPRGRKIDINGYTTADLRRQTQAILDGAAAPIAPVATPTPDPEGLTMADISTILSAIKERPSLGDIRLVVERAVKHLASGAQLRSVYIRQREHQAATQEAIAQLVAASGVTLDQAKIDAVAKAAATEAVQALADGTDVTLTVTERD